jgi:integrase
MKSYKAFTWHFPDHRRRPFNPQAFRSSPGSAPIFCTTDYESTGWLKPTAGRRHFSSSESHAEARTIRPSDIDWQRQTLQILDSKKRKIRTIPLFKLVAQELDRHRDTKSGWNRYVLSDFYTKINRSERDQIYESGRSQGRALTLGKVQHEHAIKLRKRPSSATFLKKTGNPMDGAHH